LRHRRKAFRRECECEREAKRASVSAGVLDGVPVRMRVLVRVGPGYPPGLRAPTLARARARFSTHTHPHLHAIVNCTLLSRARSSTQIDDEPENGMVERRVDTRAQSITMMQ
jgi:hypothetical protein